MKKRKLAIVCSVLLAGALGSAGPLAAASPGKALGSAVAPITIELFSDFQCPHCREMHYETIAPLITEFVNRGRVFLVRRYYPLPGHAYSRPAAFYVCAAEKIGKYQEVADLLFRTQDSWGTTGKVDETVCSILKPEEAKKVRMLVKDPAIIAEVEKDKAMGDSMKITQTPTLIITHNGKANSVAGAISYPILKRYLDTLLGQ